MTVFATLFRIMTEEGGGISIHKIYHHHQQQQASHARVYYIRWILINSYHLLSLLLLSLLLSTSTWWYYFDTVPAGTILIVQSVGVFPLNSSHFLLWIDFYSFTNPIFMNFYESILKIIQDNLLLKHTVTTLESHSRSNVIWLFFIFLWLGIYV